MNSYHFSSDIHAQHLTESTEASLMTTNAKVLPSWTVRKVDTRKNAAFTDCQESRHTHRDDWIRTAFYVNTIDCILLILTLRLLR